MKQFTTWSPDTCDCILVYSWDDESDLDTRVHSFYYAKKVCQLHEKEDNPYEAALTRNREKNKVVNELLASNPGLEPSDISFEYDKAGDLKVLQWDQPI